MTQASSTAAAAKLPSAPHWAIGYFRTSSRNVTFPISVDDIARDTAWAAALLTEHGDPPGSYLLTVSREGEAPWLYPIEAAHLGHRGPYVPVDDYAMEAGRLAMYLRRLPIATVLGITRLITEGLEKLDEQQRLAGRKLFARPDAIERLCDAGLDPFVISPVGPATAIECPARAGAHVNSAEWHLDAEGGSLLITTVGPRAAKFEQLALCVAGELDDSPCPCGRPGARVRFT